MIRKAVCFLLCLCFCFYSVSLNSSAVEEEGSPLYTADDLIDFGFSPDGLGNYIYSGNGDPFDTGISLFSTNEKNCPDFDVMNDVPWSTFPTYIREILYLSLDPLSLPKSNSFRLPFVCITVDGSNGTGNGNVNIWLGVNVGVGRINDANLNFSIFGYIRDEASNENIFPHSCLYRFAFNYRTGKVNLDWTKQEPTVYGTKTVVLPDKTSVPNLYRFAPWNIGNQEVSNDYYFYGCNGVYWPSEFTTIEATRSNVDGSLFVNFALPESGFSSGRFLSGQYLNYQFSSFNYFVPPSESELLQKEQNDLIEEGNETSKSIWETLKGIPEAIGEKIKGLFVPSEGFFDTYQQEFQTYFRERFGLLYEIPELVINLLNKILIFNPKDGDYSISFPEVVLPVLEDGEWRDEVLIEEQEFSFNFVNEAPFSLFYDIYIGFIWLVYILLLVNLVKNKANSVFNGG